MRQQPTNCLSLFDHFVGLALNRLNHWGFYWGLPSIFKTSVYIPLALNLISSHFLYYIKKQSGLKYWHKVIKLKQRMLLKLLRSFILPSVKKQAFTVYYCFITNKFPIHLSQIFMLSHINISVNNLQRKKSDLLTNLNKSQVCWAQNI